MKQYLHDLLCDLSFWLHYGARLSVLVGVLACLDVCGLCVLSAPLFCVLLAAGILLLAVEALVRNAFLERLKTLEMPADEAPTEEYPPPCPGCRGPDCSYCGRGTLPRPTVLPFKNLGEPRDC